MSTAVESITKKSWAKIVNPSASESSKKNEVVAVIDIYRETTIAESAAKEEPPKKSYSQDVDPVAFEIAQDFYEQWHSDVSATTRRNDLEKLFYQHYPNPQREFAIVLFALAKGMKVVNVFNRGQDLEWQKFSKRTINRTKRTLKKPVQSQDGWTYIGKSAPETQPEQTNDVAPSPNFNQESTPVPTLPESEETVLTMDEIIAKISKVNGEIKDLDTEIESLLVFHREHLREMKRTEEISNKSLGQYLNTFHDQMVHNLETVLDSIQSEINAKKTEKSRYCDMLKQ